jgi:formylglycine-generating enzyme required for sulfatase activity
MAETRGVDQAIRQKAPAKAFESSPVTAGGDASLDVASVKPEMIKVEGGSLPKDSQVPNKTVKAFEIGKYEVTWGEWQQVRDWAVTKGYDLKDVGQGLSENHPVTEVSWYDAVKWCNAKSEMNRVEPVYRVKGKVYKTGKTEMKGADAVTQKTGARGFRLPTDSEWEWAARGGSESKGHIYSGSNDLNAVGWFKGNSRGKPLKPGQKDPQELGKDKARLALPFYPVHSVGQKSPNDLGIYDMSGNVVEWTWDPKNNVRGGCARDPQEWNKLDLRSGIHLDYADCYLGFRLARSL